MVKPIKYFGWFVRSISMDIEGYLPLDATETNVTQAFKKGEV